MRKLKLQMNLALDNKWDKGMSDFSMDNLSNVDCLLHGRKTGDEHLEEHIHFEWRHRPGN